MIEILEKKNCSGCHACASVCPKGCIKMVEDEEGFLYPQYDKDTCVKCGLCKNICPIINKAQDKLVKPKAFACYNKDEAVRLKSSSGGMFSVLADYVLGKGGVVFGAGFNKDFEVEHQIVEKKEDLNKLRMSKYVQSRIGETYKEAEKFLKSGVLVLFTGTPCQIEGLKKYLRKDYENLYTQDLICHGVPSPRIWNEYVKYRSEKSKAEVESIEFRSKETGWKKFSFVFNFKDGTQYKKNPYRDQLMNMFLFNKNLRPSCYACSFKKISRVSDITLADFWGIKAVAPEMDDDKGTSLVLIHSERGNKLFEELKDKVVFKEVDFDLAVKRNPMVKASTKKHFRRASLMKDLNKIPYKKFLRKYGKFMI